METILIRQSGENLLSFHGCHGYQSAARNVVVKWLWWQGCPHPAVRVTALCSSLCAFLSDVCAYDLTVWLILVGWRHVCIWTEGPCCCCCPDSQLWAQVWAQSRRLFWGLRKLERLKHPERGNLRLQQYTVSQSVKKKKKTALRVLL